jgi:TRAP-type C4-dicarboxylate transport system permease small subunit
LLTDLFPEGLRKYALHFASLCVVFLFGVIFFLGSEMVNLDHRVIDPLGILSDYLSDHPNHL